MLVEAGGQACGAGRTRDLVTRARQIGCGPDGIWIWPSIGIRVSPGVVERASPAKFLGVEFVDVTSMSWVLSALLLTTSSSLPIIIASLGVLFGTAAEGPRSLIEASI